ncbi:MAG TPA: CBS domain-containing protein [Anaerolineales bacterium]|nr:CBS domain-containing protein [Anaerolineales bacterium]HMR99750.1 CBS domain-containing protein [Anaerolineales bacterium]HNQ93766.1 CBS domain-containing protein [Anaerolineales bacterium]HNS60515.1 CBS domain-containing protein [Anaerolineales bacterium]
MATVQDMIRKKGAEIFSISPSASALEALKLLEKHNMGAALVMEGGEVKGILSERDCVRKLELAGKQAKDTQVGEIMTEKVITIEAEEDLEACMSLMLEKNIRHLPVYSGGKLKGLISVRDVLREVVEAQKSMIAQLEQYIGGR